MPAMPGVPAPPGPGRNMARVAKRLKRNGADDRGALQDIRSLLAERGYSGLQKPGDIVEALEHLLLGREEGMEMPPALSTTLPIPQPHAVPAAPSGIGIAPPEAVAIARAAFGASPKAPSVPPLLSFAEIMAGPAPTSAHPAPAPASAPPSATIADPASGPPARTGPLDIHTFQARFEKNAATAAAANMAEAGGAPRPKGASPAGARFLSGKTGRKPPVDNQYEILQAITGKKAAPAPPSGIVNAMAR